MIRLTPRPARPAASGRVATKRTNELARFIAEHPAAWLAGTVVLRFDAAYRHPDVKAALVAWQHDKCAFCESAVTATQHGDVEHLRPKAAWLDEETGDLVRPGWWWLAYEWTNLYFSCQLCNQRFKANRFPLEPGSARCTEPEHDPAAERPLLLDPVADEPAEHLGLGGDDLVPRTRRGEASIEVLGLNRPAMREARMSHLVLVRALVAVLDGASGEVRDAAVSGLRHATRRDRPFCGSVRALVPEFLHDTSLDG